MISLVVHDKDRVNLHEYYIAIQEDVNYAKQADNLIDFIVDYVPSRTVSIAVKRVATRIAGGSGDVDEIYRELFDAILAEGGLDESKS
jgi:hypothetical protein